LASLLQCKGLKTFVNRLGALPEGSLLQAKNIVVDRDGIAEPRRGFNIYGTAYPALDDRTNSLLAYKGRVLRHFDSTLQYDSDGLGTFASFSGSIDPVETGLRIKGVESNGNYYFTTDTGIRKIPAKVASDLSTATIVYAGGPKALDASIVITYSTAGFMAANSKVAYRVVWGLNDINDNLILGTPSSRAVLTNISATLTANTILTFSIPSDVTTEDYFYQIYRTGVLEAGAVSLDDIDPGEEFNLVYEANVSSSDISAGSITITDQTPDDFRIGGTPLYTNESTGDGILQANDKPPLAKDVALFQESTFYANTKTYHRLELNLLGVNSFISGTSQFVVSDGTTTRVYTFVGATEQTGVVCDTANNTAQSSYFLLNSASDERKYFIWFNKDAAGTQPSGSDTVGRIPVPIAITSGDTSTSVATAVKTAVDALDDFTATSSSAVVAIFCVKNGNVTNATNGLVAPGGAFSISITINGDGEDLNTANGGDVLLSSLASAAQAVDETARSLVRAINADTNGFVNAFYLSGSNDLPGDILLERRTLVDSYFYLALNQSALVSQFNPTIPVLKAITSVSVANPTHVGSASHGFITGNNVLIFDTGVTPSINGLRVVTKIDANNFTVPVTVTANSDQTGYAFRDTARSSNETTPNRIYFSKTQQPDAVPITNFFPVGTKDKVIKRIIALRNSLYVFKEDGIYRVVPAPGGFSSTLFDSSTIIIAPDTACVLNNKIYALTHQGVVTVSDAGVEIISRYIEDLIAKPSRFTDFSTIAFAAAYETDRAYLLWLPTKSNDTYATQCFRYNVFTDTWTQWIVSAQAAIVNVPENVLYIGSADIRYIEKERKSFTISDFADRTLDVAVLPNKVTGASLTLTSVSGVVVGDVLQQTQYLTISEFNRLLKRLDIDVLVGGADYFSTLEVVAGDDLVIAVAALAAKLDADSGVTDTNYGASISGGVGFSAIQSDFNIIINKLNLDTGVKFQDYQTSTGTKDFHGPILSITTLSNDVTMPVGLSWVAGEAIVLKAIETVVEWAPVHFGQPEVFKQISEGTVMFESSDFTQAELKFKTDLSPSFEGVTFRRDGTGEFGFSTFGTGSFGGGGNSAPFRTLVPRNKQRCRYISPKFTHKVALEKYALLGISFVPRLYSTRAYR
jgi:hypothetical protein